MAKDPSRGSAFKVHFVDLPEGQAAPSFAAYEVDEAGRPLRKLAVSREQTIDLGESFAKLRNIAFGPDVDDLGKLAKGSLVRYRVESVLESWTTSGIYIGRDIWERFPLFITCVSGVAKKCRPWWWDVVVAAPFDRLGLARTSVARILEPVGLDLFPHLFPWRCLPLCDGIVEIYERSCCCDLIRIPDLFDRLRDILDYLPIPIPDPIPDPDPGPLRIPGPVERGRIGPRLAGSRAAVAAAKSRRAAFDPTKIELNRIPAKRLYEDYVALRSLRSEALQLEYVRAHPYLISICCHCTTHKVGETSLQPGGRFDFCYVDLPYIHPFHLLCYKLFAYRIKQFIGGVWVVVYDGLAAHDYFAAGETAELHSYDKRAIVCDDPDNQGDGTAYAMLDVVGTTEHFNFPSQVAESQLAALDADDGTVVFGGVEGCPWGSSLSLHLLITPEMKPAAVGAKYYRLKVAPVNDAGHIVGTPEILDEQVTWQRRIIGGSGPQIWEPIVLGPLPAPSPGGESNLFTIPYWELGVNEWRMGIAQPHQIWNTAGMKNDGNLISPNGKHALILELFGNDGKRIKPTGAAGAGTAKPFAYKRWQNAPNNAVNVIHADLVHAFWVDNTRVVADIVDLRKGGIANSDECQFMSGTGSTTFSIGFRAYHVNGVDHAGNGDANSFMHNYGISWQRGLNGSSGSLGHAPIYPDNHHDVAETGPAESSDTETFETLLTKPDGTVHSKCTFSVTLQVNPKHTNGTNRLWQFEWHETASFALEII